MHLAPLSLTGLTDSKQKLYQMKLFLQKTANCTRSAASYAAAPPAPPGGRPRVAPRRSPPTDLLPSTSCQIASAAELLAEEAVALRKKRNREEISEAELTTRCATSSACSPSRRAKFCRV